MEKMSICSNADSCEIYCCYHKTPHVNLKCEDICPIYSGVFCVGLPIVTDSFDSLSKVMTSAFSLYFFRPT